MPSNTQQWMAEWQRKLDQIEQDWNSREGLDEETRQRGKGNACLREGQALLNGSPGERELQIALLAFIDAERRYYRYVVGSEDDIAETRYQRGRVLEEATVLGFVNEGFSGVGREYALAARDAKSKKTYYETKFREFLKRRESLISAKLRDMLIRDAGF